MHPIQFVPGTLSQCPTNSIPSLSMTSLGGGVTVLYSYVCSSLSVILFLFKVKVTIGTKNHNILRSLDREISVIFRHLSPHGGASEHTRARSGSKSGKNRTCRRNSRRWYSYDGTTYIDHDFAKKVLKEFVREKHTSELAVVPYSKTRTLPTLFWKFVFP